MEASTTQRWRALMQILVAILTLGVDMYPTRRNTTEAAITFRGMVDVPKRFPDSGDDRGTGDFQPFNRTSLNGNLVGVQLKTVWRISHHCGFSGTSQTTVPCLSPVASLSAMCRSPSASTLTATTRPVTANHFCSIPVRSDS